MAACPFTSRLPSLFKNNYTSSLLKTYSKQCPVASRTMITTAGSQGTSSKPQQKLADMEEVRLSKGLKLGFMPIKKFRVNGRSQTKQKDDFGDGRSKILFIVGYFELLIIIIILIICMNLKGQDFCNPRITEQT